MVPEDVVAVIDTSSIAEIRRGVQNARKRQVFDALSQLAEGGALYFPKQVVKELERSADPASPDPQLSWAKGAESLGAVLPVSFEAVREVLAQVPRVIDPDKQGADEADPYILALALELQRGGRRVVVVTEENKETPTKMSLRTAAGILGLPSVPLAAFLESKTIM